MIELIGLQPEELNTYAPDFWHTHDWIDYCINSNFEKGIDHTFALYESGKIQAIFPLIKETCGNNESYGNQFTFQRSYCPSILLEDKKYLGKIADILKTYARKNDVQRIAIEGYIPGFNQKVVSMCINNLNENQAIRNSYKSLIKRAEKSLECKIINDKQSLKKIFDYVNKVQALYFEIAKKVTRPLETFEMYKKWITKGFASLFLAILDDKIVGFTLVTHYRDEAYYFLCGIVEEYKKSNVSHYLQGMTVRYLKEKGIKNYILGDISAMYSNSCNDDEIIQIKKEKDIAFFKSGFGDPFRYKVVSECVL